MAATYTTVIQIALLCLCLGGLAVVLGVQAGAVLWLGAYGLAIGAPVIALARWLTT